MGLYAWAVRDGDVTPVIVELVGLEAVQTIQDWTNSVKLIEDKTTYVRAHFKTKDTTPVYVEAQMRGFRNGVELPDSPLKAINKGGKILAWPDAAGQRNNLSRCLNFRLPQTWLHGTIELHIESVGIVGAAIEFKEPAEEGGTANDGIVKITFVPTDDLEVRLVAINWTDFAGTAHNPTSTHLNELTQRLRAIYPVDDVDVTTTSFTWTGTGPPSQSSTILAIVNHKLETMRANDGCNDAHCCGRLYYGAIVGGRVDAIGLANGIPGTVASGNPGSTGAFEPNVHAHELGHCLGQHHAVSQALFGTWTSSGGTVYKLGACGERASLNAPEFPYFSEIGGLDRATIGPMSLGNDRLIYGLDTRAMNVLDPNQNFDLMSYCSPLWISDFTYEALQGEINNRFPSGSFCCKYGCGGKLEQYMLVRGSVNFISDAIEFLPFGRLISPTLLTEPAAGDYSLELRDSVGNLIRSFSFQPNEYTGLEGEVETGSFLIPVPADPLIKQAVVFRNGIMLNSVAASSTPPTVQVVYPNGGEHLTGEKVTLNWVAGDIDGDILTYTIQYSFDGGNTWETLIVDYPNMNYDISLALLKETTNGLIRIIASDGFNTALDDSDGPFSVPNNQPEVYITSPTEGAVFAGEQQIFFEANTQDREDGRLPATNIQWSSNIDGSFGTGNFNRIATDLSEGSHLITVTATDGGGLNVSASVNIQVYRTAPPNNPPIADAGDDQTKEQTSNEGAEVTLDGSGSTDLDGDILDYEWAWDGGSATGVNPVVTIPPGAITITLTVFDGMMITTDEVVINVITYDFDSDGKYNYQDNCPNHFNPGQEDTYPPEGNMCGDACECEGDFNHDTDQDGSDAAVFKHEFGRSSFLNPCSQTNSCLGNFDSDQDVDGMDAAKFKEDFGRSIYHDICPICVVAP